jgi:hypothetical protein
MYNYNNQKVDWNALLAGLQKYEWIMKRFRMVDVEHDALFQRRFNGFYRVRRGEEFRLALFEFLEKNKNEKVTFEQAVMYFVQHFGRLEASFASKAVATINPNLPVWDSQVLANLNLEASKPYQPMHKRVPTTLRIYDRIRQWYDSFLETETAAEMLSDFDKRFPDKDLTNLKKVDLILWQTRTGNEKQDNPFSRQMKRQEIF